MKKDGFRILVILAAFLLLPAYCNALIEEKSSIIGTLVGASNKPLTGITVHLLDSFFLSEVTKAVTDENGKFTLSSLLPGLYLISVEAPSLAGAFRRVQVVSGTPTFIDLRSVLSDEQLKEHDAWKRLKWTIRVAERNPLHQGENPSKETAAVQNGSDGFFAFLRSLRESNNIKGEVSYVNVGAGPSSSSWGHQITEFALQGELEGEGTWSVNGNFLDGPRLNYIASGELQYHLFGHQLGAAFAANDLLFARYPGVERQLIRNFIESPDATYAVDKNKLWITSVDLKDEWQLLPRLQMAYATRIDYYGYLQQPVSYSPRIQFAYQLLPSLSLRGRYFRNQSAPGNYYLQPDEVHPYIHDVAFVPYQQNLHPETTVGYEAGFDLNGEDYHISVFYHNEDIANKIATIDLTDSPVNEKLQSFRPFVILNSTDLHSHGTGVSMSKRISPVLTAVGSYRLTQSVPVYIIEKRSITERHLFFKNGKETADYHDIEAGLEASFQQTQTEVRADWKWSSGSPLVFGHKENNSSLSAVDLEVHQGIPVQVFSQTQLELLLAIKNLLDQNPDSNGNADFQRALLYSMPRVIAGGLLLKF